MDKSPQDFASGVSGRKPRPSEAGMRLVEFKGNPAANNEATGPEANPRKLGAGKRKIVKAKEIRKEAEKMVSEGRLPRPVEIIEALRIRGIKVHSGQVTTALMGTDLALSRQKSQLDQRLIDSPDPRAAIGAVSLDEVIQAREYVRAIGSVGRAVAALAAYRAFASEGDASTGRLDVDASGEPRREAHG